MLNRTEMQQILPETWLELPMTMPRLFRTHSLPKPTIAISALQDLSSQMLKLLSPKPSPTPTAQFSFKPNKMLKPPLMPLKFARMLLMLSTPEYLLQRPPLIPQ